MSGLHVLHTLPLPIAPGLPQKHPVFPKNQFGIYKRQPSPVPTSRHPNQIGRTISLFGWNANEANERLSEPNYHSVDPPFSPSLLSGTFLAGHIHTALLTFSPHQCGVLLISSIFSPTGRELKCCYKASLDGFSATHFHLRCDFRGPCVVIGLTDRMLRFGGFNPEGFRSTDDYFDTFDAFLFYWPTEVNGEAVILPKVGGSGAALFDYARGGPQFGADGLLIGPPLAPVMGGFAGPDTNSGVGDLTFAKSRLGLSYAKRPDGKESIFGDDKSAILTEVEVYCSPHVAKMY